MNFAVDTWVAVAVMSDTITISSRNAFATEPINGRQSIFNRPATETTERTRVVVIGVYYTPAAADQAAQAWRTNLDHTGHDVTVTGPHPVGAPVDTRPPGTGPTIVACRECGTPVGDGTGLCEPCRKRLFAQAGARDADIINETVQVT